MIEKSRSFWVFVLLLLPVLGLILARNWVGTPGLTSDDRTVFCHGWPIVFLVRDSRTYDGPNTWEYSSLFPTDDAAVLSFLVPYLILDALILIASGIGLHYLTSKLRFDLLAFMILSAWIGSVLCSFGQYQFLGGSIIHLIEVVSSILLVLPWLTIAKYAPNWFQRNGHAT